jgi:ketosteroid isomerase-like protein
MAGENVEVIRRGLDAFARRDIDDAWLDCFTTDVEVVEDPTIPDAASYSGHEGLRRWLDAMERNWNDFEVHGEKFVESGEHVVALHRVSGRSTKTMIEVDGRFASVFTIAHGRVTRWTMYAGWAPALEGLQRLIAPVDHLGADTPIGSTERSPSAWSDPPLAEPGASLIDPFS